MIVALLALLLFPQADQDAPKPVIGPGLLCLKHSSFALLAGERVIRSGGGVETLHLELESPQGRYWIHESDILAAPKSFARRLVETRRDARLYAVGSDGYMFRGRLPESLHGEADGKPRDRFIASIGGDALRRERQARSVLSRLKLGIPTTENCIMRYQYGWEYALPAET